MAMNSLVAVSNPIPSRLRRQNFSWYCSSVTGGPPFASCHWIFISSSFSTSHNSSFEHNWLHSPWSQRWPTCFPSQSWRVSCVYPTSRAHGLLVAAPGCTHCSQRWPPPFVQGTLLSECGLLSPLAALLSSCFHTPHSPSDTTCTQPFFCTHTFASAVHKEMCHSPPEEILQLPWYGLVFFTISLFMQPLHVEGTCQLVLLIGQHTLGICLDIHSWTMHQLEERKVNHHACSSSLSTRHALWIMVLTLSAFLNSSRRSRYSILIVEGNESISLVYHVSLELKFKLSYMSFRPSKQSHSWVRDPSTIQTHDTGESHNSCSLMLITRSLASYFFISLVLGPLNSLLWYVPASRYIWSCRNKK